MLYVAFAGAVAAGVPAQSDALTPEAIYLRAVHAMKAAPLPAYVTFRETIAGRNFRLSCSSDGEAVTIHHGDAHAAFDVWYRTSDGSALSKPLDEPSASPCPGTLLAPAGADISAMGVPQASAAPGPAATDAGGGPPLIAAVRVEAPTFYRIVLAGREQLGGNDVYHLKLTAYRDPQTHPLTDLYVDPETFLVREARGEVSGHYVIASGRVAGIVDFDRVGDYWLVRSELFDIAANALLVHARLHAQIDATDIATPSELPGIAFPTSSPSPLPKAPK